MHAISTPSDSDFALYSIGKLSIPLVALVYISAGNVIMPEIAKYSKTMDLDSILALWKKMILKNSIITIPIYLNVLEDSCAGWIIGDINQDYEFNILDITILVNIVLDLLKVFELV